MKLVFRGTIAIGDVHGRPDLLEPLLDYARARYPQARVIFLGDIIDRGTSSRQAMDIVADELNSRPASILIQRIHEELMLRFIDRDAQFSRGWRINGGDATVASYGLTGHEYIGDDGQGRFHEELRGRFIDEFESHISLMREAATYVEGLKHVFVHAGIDPALPLERQDPYLMRWDSKALIAYADPLPKVIVHGHVVCADHCMEFHSNRINVDTGACLSNKLSGVVISTDGTVISVLGASGSDRERITVTAMDPPDLA